MCCGVQVNWTLNDLLNLHFFLPPSLSLCRNLLSDFCLVRVLIESCWIWCLMRVYFFMLLSITFYFEPSKSFIYVRAYHDIWFQHVTSRHWAHDSRCSTDKSKSKSKSKDISAHCCIRSFFNSEIRRQIKWNAETNIHFYLSAPLKYE